MLQGEVGTKEGVVKMAGDKLLVCEVAVKELSLIEFMSCMLSGFVFVPFLEVGRPS